MLRITLILFAFVICSVFSYEIPEPKFQLLKPYGFRAYIPDEDGIRLFAFHGNLNKPLDYNSIGQMSSDVIAKTNGKWVYENKTAKINYGDRLYYWVFVIKSGEGYRLDESVHVFDDMQVKRLKKKMGHLRKKRHSYSDYSGEDYPNYYNNKKKFPSFYPGESFTLEPYSQESSYENNYQPHGFYDNYFKHHHHHQHKFNNCHHPHKPGQKTTTKHPRTKMTTVATTTTTETSTFPNIDVRFGENQ